MSSPATARTIPEWLVETLIELERLSQLPRNWDSYGAEPVKAEVLGLSMRLLGSLDISNLSVPHVSAGSAGTVVLEWQADRRKLELEILGQDSIGYLKQHSDGRMEEAEVTSDLPQTLKRLIEWLVHKQ